MMLKFQIALIAILIGCVAFISCDRVPKMLEPVADDMDAGDDTTTDTTMDMMKMMMDMEMHKSWDSVTLPTPIDTGVAHGTGARTVYFNEVGAMANMAETAYPAGTMIVKEIMDDTNTFVEKVAKMVKTDSADPMSAMYKDHDYWMYVQVKLDAMSNVIEGETKGDVPGGSSAGCHGCHSTAANDKVFVPLSMADATGMDAGDDTTTDTTTDPPMDMVMKMMMDMEMHKSWDSVTLPTPIDTGVAHGTGARTVYFNEVGAMANMAETAYPAGTMIVKEIMDDTNTFVEKVAKMVKTDSADPMSAMYKDHGYWMYVQVKLDAMSNVIEGETKGDVPGGSSAGCHGCHSTAPNDKVFVPLSMADAAGMNGDGDGAAQ